jgi:hypothetical protein
MSTRHLNDLPARWAEPILTMLELTRTAATPPDVDPTPWAAAEAGQVRIRTGYRAARRTASAGQYAAHTLRLHAAAAVAGGDQRPWTRALSNTGAAISSWDWDTRMRGALDLRATTNHLPAVERAEAVPARLVAAWLTHNHGPQLVPATGRLCTYVLEHPSVDTSDLAAAWDATHGHRLQRGDRAA